MKYFLYSCLFLLFLGSAADSQVHYNDDGSVSRTGKSGNNETVSMEGKTAYGAKIPLHREIIRRRDFVIELVYSPEHSDMPLRYEEKSNPVDRFFRELGNQWAGWLNNQGSRAGKLTVVVSNCRISKTGFCGRKKKNEILITSYFKGAKIAEKSLSYQDILDKKKVTALARETVTALSPFRHP